MVVQALCPIVVGRGAELAALHARLVAALDGQGCSVALVGEAGIGKSRLAREVAREAEARAATVVLGRATPSGAHVAYRPLTEAMAQALRGKPVLDDPGLATWLPALAGIVPHPGSPAAANELSPAVRGEAVLQFVTRLADPHGLVVVLEDLHWADPDTLLVLEYLVDNLAGQRVLCVMTVRDEEPSPALDLVRRRRGGPGVAHLELGRLDAKEVAAMVRACAPDVSGSVVERVSARADGVPLLVEELLASPGVPASFTDTVRARLDTLPRPFRRVVDAAAVLGRQFDWRLLPPMTGLPPAIVSEALGAGVERLLLRVENGSFRFRHSLTRDAVLAELLPPDHVALAAAGLAALEGRRPSLKGQLRELAADLAERSGNRRRAAMLLTGAGRDALRSGALATAARTLERAAELAVPGRARATTVIALVEALALAGRVDEAAAAAQRALGQPAGARLSRKDRTELNLLLSHAAIEAGRWHMATERLEAVLGDERELAEASLTAQVAVLQAEVALGTDDIELARRKARDALALATDASELRCHALEVLGRIERLSDRALARDCFEQALNSAEVAGLAIWRARALHELGTIDMFDHLGSERLDQACHAAEGLGALATAASIHLQLAAVYVSRWLPDAAAKHACSARELAEALKLGAVRNKALLFLAEASALRGDPDDVEHHLGLACQPEVAGSQFEGFCWGARAEAMLARGQIPRALEYLDRATTLLARVPHAEPAAFRALWPLLLASVDDSRAISALEQARQGGVDAFNLNAGLLGYAEAILAGRAGDPERADAIAGEVDRRFLNAATWRVLARTLAADPAATDGWGKPRVWLEEGASAFATLKLPGLASWCRSRLTGSRTDGSMGAGITAREANVLALVADGLANKEIAQRLGVSARTVEKHIEALLRKTGTRSRTQLVIWASKAEVSPPTAPAMGEPRLHTSVRRRW